MCRCHRRYRYPYRRRRMTAGEAAIPVVIGVVIAAATAQAASHPAKTSTHAAASLPAAPGVLTDASSFTPSSWAATLLTSAGFRLTACNIGAIESWERAEGGNWENTASFNPLNTTLRMAGSRTVNYDGVQAYTSWRQGLTATVATLRNGDYGGILAALAAGDDAQRVGDAVGASPWGTGWFGAACA